MQVVLPQVLLRTSLLPLYQLLCQTELLNLWCSLFAGKPVFAPSSHLFGSRAPGTQLICCHFPFPTATPTHNHPALSVDSITTHPSRPSPTRNWSLRSFIWACRTRCTGTSIRLSRQSSAWHGMLRYGVLLTYTPALPYTRASSSSFDDHIKDPYVISPSGNAHLSTAESHQAPYLGVQQPSTSCDIA